MCGIIGYTGRKNSVDILIEGLKRMEYRGYDSSGIAILNNNNEIITIKKKGKIQELINTINDRKYPSHTGIAHTRWATHGEPNDINAHPHSDCKNEISIVHNGIVENFISLKDYLVSKGHKFVSETDTEIIKAVSGNDALKLTIDNEFALAILDVHMPGMDGYELAEFLRSEEKTRQRCRDRAKGQWLSKNIWRCQILCALSKEKRKGRNRRQRGRRAIPPNSRTVCCIEIR